MDKALSEMIAALYQRVVVRPEAALEVAGEEKQGDTRECCLADAAEGMFLDRVLELMGQLKAAWLVGLGLIRDGRLYEQIGIHSWEDFCSMELHVDRRTGDYRAAAGAVLAEMYPDLLRYFARACPNADSEPLVLPPLALPPPDNERQLRPLVSMRKAGYDIEVVTEVWAEAFEETKARKGRKNPNPSAQIVENVARRHRAASRADPHPSSAGPALARAAMLADFAQFCRRHNLLEGEVVYYCWGLDRLMVSWSAAAGSLGAAREEMRRWAERSGINFEVLEEEPPPTTAI